MFGSFIGPALSFIGGELASKRTQASAREANEHGSREADKQMKFQERMSNTAHQRARKDLKEAGFNPLLAVTQSAASSPAGAAGGQTAASFENPLQGAVSTAMQAQELKLAIAKQKEEIASMKEGRELTKAQKAKAQAETTAISKTFPETDAKNQFWNSFLNMGRASAKEREKSDKLWRDAIDRAKEREKSNQLQRNSLQMKGLK